MAEKARVENGQVVEIIDEASLPAAPETFIGEAPADTSGGIPSHKAGLWKDVQRSGSGPIETVSINGNVVQIVRSQRPVTETDVVMERTRRLALGFNYDFGDARGVHRIGTTDADLKGWSEVSTFAGALIDSGQVDVTIAIATDTGPCQVTPAEWRVIEIASAMFRQPLWTKSFALMAMNPIPADYANDSYWT